MIYRLFEGAYLILVGMIDPNDDGIIMHRNIGNYLPVGTA